MAARTCFNCVYCICDPFQWLRWLDEGESIVPQCANHPQWRGQLHDVPGVPCRHYRPKPAVPQGDGVRMIALGDGGYTYVDAADYSWLNQRTWHLNSGYACRVENGKNVFMHREIMQPPAGKVVDHGDGSRANNCRFNLRPATRAQNSRNKCKHSGSYSRYKCVFYCRKSHKWYARCRYQGRRYVLGYFDTEVEAARAYDRKAVEWFGEFARLNFPEEWPPARRAEVYAQRKEPEKQGKSRKAKGKRKKGKRSERVPKRKIPRLGAQFRLQAGKTSPPRVNAELPTADSKTPGRRRGTNGKRTRGEGGKPPTKVRRSEGRKVGRKKRSRRIVKRQRVARLVPSHARRPTKRASQPQPTDDRPASVRGGTRRRRERKATRRGE